MFSKILIKVFNLARPEFTKNTVRELFVEIIIVMSKLAIMLSWYLIRRKIFYLIQGFDLFCSIS